MGAITRFRNYLGERRRRAFERRDTGWDLRTLIVDTTSGCNLRCVFCSQPRWHPDYGNMSLESFQQLNDVLPRLRCISFSNSAEPLLNRDLFRMVRIAKKATRGMIRTGFTTNGTLIDEEIVDGIRSCGLDAIEVSLDGATAETYERLRRGARFDLVVQNVERLVQLSARSRVGIPHVSLRFVACERNARELPRLVDLAHRLGVPQVVVNGLAPHDPEMAGEEIHDLGPTKEATEVFQEAWDRAVRLGIRLDLPALVPDTVEHCTLASSSCVLLANGSVVPCSMVAYRRPFFHREGPRENPQHAFGNINERSLWDIWHSPDYVAFRRDVKEGRLPSFCEDCLHMSGVLSSLEHWRWLSAEPCSR